MRLLQPTNSNIDCNGVTYSARNAEATSRRQVRVVAMTTASSSSPYPATTDTSSEQTTTTSAAAAPCICCRPRPGLDAGPPPCLGFPGIWKRPPTTWRTPRSWNRSTVCHRRLRMAVLVHTRPGFPYSSPPLYSNNHNCLLTAVAYDLNIYLLNDSQLSQRVRAKACHHKFTPGRKFLSTSQPF